MSTATLTQASLDPVERRTLDRLVELLREEIGDDLHAIWLYGSRARGEKPGPESDVDVLVVADGGWDRYEMRAIQLANHAADEMGGKAAFYSVKVLSPEGIAHDREIRSFFIQEVDRDKIVLHGEA